MSKQESFKRRVRERMHKTGERYAAARRVLIEQQSNHRRVWVSEPEVSDDTILSTTKKGWDDWCDLIDRGPEFSGDHSQIAAYLQTAHRVDAWWAQTITVGYERIMGLRLPYQRPDGTFSAGKSRTVRTDASRLRAMLLDGEDRENLFPGQETELRSKPTSKAVRLAIGPGVAQFGIEPKADGRVKVSIIHERLHDFDAVAEWKFYWGEWLEAIDQNGSQGDN